MTIDGLSVYYDALGAEIGVQTNSAFNQMFETALGRIITSSSGLLEARISLPGGVMAKWGPSGLIGYFHSDWRDNVIAASDPSGNYLGSAAYAPFGEFYAVNNLLSYFMRLGADTAAGETDTASRKYHWNSGRFIQPDPSGSANLSSPQTLNQYAYVSNMPMEDSDPSGLTESRAELSEEQRELEGKLGGAYEAEKRMERGESPFGGYWGETESMYNARMGFPRDISMEWAGPLAGSLGHGPALPHPSATDDGAPDTGQNTSAAGNQEQTQHQPNSSQTPSTHFVSISFWPSGAGHLGHIGIGVDTDNTSGFATKKPHSFLPFLAGFFFAGKVQDDVKAHTNPATREVASHHYLHIPISSRSAQAMEQAIDARFRSPGLYNLYFRNCSGFVEHVLRVGGVGGVPHSEIFSPPALYGILWYVNTWR